MLLTTCAAALSLLLLPTATDATSARANLYARRAEVFNRRQDMGVLPMPPPEPNVPYCPELKPDFKAPKENIFMEFSADELKSIKTYLVGLPELNLTASEPQLSDNYIWKIEKVPPRKAPAISYLDANGTKPEAFAEVTIYNGNTPFSIKQYIVGPLPIGPTTIAKLRRTLPWHGRFIDDVEYKALYPALARTLGIPLAEAGISNDLFGGNFTNNAGDSLQFIDTNFITNRGDYRKLWMYVVRPGDGFYIRPVGLQILMNMSGTDPSRWAPDMIIYNDQVFYTTDAFIRAYQIGSLRIARRYREPAEEGPWSSMYATGPIRQFDDRRGPRIVANNGPRYQVDKEQKYVEWMGWSFWMKHSRDNGVALMDVKFKGQRIAYEIMLSEALAQYAGSDPVQGNCVYLDSYYGIGSSMFEQLDGFDCPHGSTYLDITVSEGSSKTTKNAICIFEEDSNLVLSRHWGDVGDGTYYGFGATKGYNLVVRTSAAVYNYDYIFDYVFWLDGSIEIKVAASGYMQGTFWDPVDETGYGVRISEFGMGSVHDHIMNYKIDLDVAGLRNSFQHTEVTTERPTFQWLQIGQTLVQKKLTHTIEPVEFGYEEMGPDLMSTVWKFINSDVKNRWGNPKGYRIMAKSPMKSQLRGNTLSLQLANWAKYFIAVTRRKDDEQSASDIFNQNLPQNSPFNFDWILNRETIVQEDLVAWVNLGHTHVPRAEDAPLTTTSASRGSILITPFNYFDEMASRDVRSGAYVEPPSAPGEFGNLSYNDQQNTECYSPNTQVPYGGISKVND
ncbi:hypothetical protein HDU96_006482 [Phlyctochytrium bullatum]|nr:hypothetical protein HDU96_006482 [Phlyctochytrium bullatum]